MNREQLRQTLFAEQFRPSTYSLYEQAATEALCLREEGSSWVVFYSERGLQTGRVVFGSEQEACEYFLREMRADPSLKRDWKPDVPLIR